MSIQLEPREYFVVVRQLQDHTDSTTYYVRATIRDAKTDELLSQFALEDKADRRFSKQWQVCPDVSGLGRYISILSEVFTDSGYTSKASTYGDEMETYLVQQRRSNIGGGGGGSDVDYTKIKKMIDEAVKGIKMPMVPKVSLEPVLQKLARISDAVGSIKPAVFPAIPPVNLQPVISEMKALHGAVLEGIEAIPGRDKNDIQPLADALEKLDINGMKESMKKATDEVSSCLEDFKEFFEDMPELQEKLDDLTVKFKEVIVNMAVAGYKKEEPTLEDKEKGMLKYKRIAAKLRS